MCSESQAAQTDAESALSKLQAGQFQCVTLGKGGREVVRGWEVLGGGLAAEMEGWWMWEVW